MRNEELWYRLAAIDFLFCRGEQCSPEWDPHFLSCSVLAIFGRRYRTFLSLIKIVSDKFNMCVNIEFT